MNPQFRQTLIVVPVVLAFLLAMFGAAWLGVFAAKRTLPDGVLVSPALAPGATVSLDTADEPIYLAPAVQPLRDFFFAYQSPEARRDGDAEARDLRRVFEELEVRILSRDADAYEVEVLSGPLSGTKAWVQESQLPPPPK